jgi:hypothetical protein
MQNASLRHIFSQTFAKIFIYSLETGVWNNLDEKQLGHKINVGPSKLPPNLFANLKFGMGYLNI